MAVATHRGLTVLHRETVICNADVCHAMQCDAIQIDPVARVSVLWQHWTAHGVLAKSKRIVRWLPFPTDHPLTTKRWVKCGMRVLRYWGSICPLLLTSCGRGMISDSFRWNWVNCPLDESWVNNVEKTNKKKKKERKKKKKTKMKEIWFCFFFSSK